MGWRRKKRRHAQPAQNSALATPVQGADVALDRMAEPLAASKAQEPSQREPPQPPPGPPLPLPPLPPLPGPSMPQPEPPMPPPGPPMPPPGPLAAPAGLTATEPPQPVLSEPTPLQPPQRPHNWANFTFEERPQRPERHPTATDPRARAGPPSAPPPPQPQPPTIATAQQAIDAAASHGMADLCAAIGVPRGASSEEARKRAKEIFKLVHPDKCSLPGAAEAFDVVRTAERVLTDETEWRKHQAEMARRRKMDREVREHASRAAANPPGSPPSGRCPRSARQPGALRALLISCSRPRRPCDGL